MKKAFEIVGPVTRGTEKWHYYIAVKRNLAARTEYASIRLPSTKKATKTQLDRLLLKALRCEGAQHDRR
ncbi:MAG: hypothetical protein ABFD89_06330 [Bryobacteraceae bacterium]